jgi:hypothetical protein
MTDGALLAEAVERLHPDPFRSVSRERFRAEAAQAETAVELMRLLALLGDRNGHTAIRPLDDHAAPFHLLPLSAYEFEDGVFVVAAARRELVGRELRAVNGVPVEELNEALTPLVSHDNGWTIRARRPVFAVAVEVLRGLGIVADGPDVTLRLGERDVGLAPVGAPDYLARFGSADRLPDASPDRQIARVGTWVHAVYAVTRGDTAEFSRGIEAAAARAERVVLDLRQNGGGNNQTYGPLLACLERLGAAGKRLVVLTSRVTFSAAMQLVVDLEQRTPAVFVGEPTGGSPNQFGDAVPVDLPESSLTARVATVSWTTAGADDERVAREPDVLVPLTSSAFFSGADPVLRAALEA